MKAKNLEKAAAILPKIYALDAEVVAIEKKCLAILDGQQHTNIKLTLGMRPPEKVKTFTEQDIIDEITDQIHKQQPHPNAFRFHFMPGAFAENGFLRMEPPKEHPDGRGPDILESVGMDLNDTETVTVLNALLEIKRYQREKLVHQILSLDVQL